MALASRILSIVLGAAVMVFVLWPITIPVGFGEVWWASRQAQPRPDTPPAAAPEPRPEAKPAAAPISSASRPSPHDVLPNAAEQTPPAPDQAKSEAEQLAALKESDKTGAVAPQAATKLYRRITVRDGGTLQADGVVIRLAGITVREVNATCKDARGQTWPCGAAAKFALARLIRARAVTCTLPKGGEHNIFVARCGVGNTDLSAWMVRQGWAAPKEPAEPALAEAAGAAKDERLGVWRASD
jgi:endonuclease YncB( thermonuclease family)